MKRLAATVLFVVTLVFAWPPAPIAQEKSPGAGPVIVLVVSLAVAVSLSLSRVRKVLRGPA